MLIRTVESTPRRRSSWNLAVMRVWSCLALVALLVIACGEPPEKALRDAEDALLEAAGVSECAEQEYRAAELALAEAKALVEEGEYDDAEKRAIEAKRLAEQAKATGNARWDDCQAAKMPQEGEFEVAPDKLEAILFDFNESVLTETAKKTLQGNAEWIKSRPKMSLIIEGHCDEQGTVDYNLALGELRAAAAKTYLVRLGVSQTKLSLVSYGAELPVDLSLSAEAFRKNRRAEFKVKQ